MTTHMVLVRAKEYLLNHGWMQGDAGFHGGPRCLMGAVESAGGPDADAPCFAALSAVVDMCGVRLWNDASYRTFDEVIAALDKAIWATAPESSDSAALPVVS